ncbi:uncharacterized protein LOC143849812 [Tasmannia lanceolata]|uniref:uncharacterized protein LOC143849812 n=1 Tax=Tasmannia lanceolata TaxID=3420 RepID=UPI0040639D02
MEEAEKMVALKRAYAEIILNTAKEAAARILVSERKALRFEQDILYSKEEALNILLHLKQIMDTKISEAEKTSLDQKRKVQELEAQLNEAKGTINDLRAELRRVNDALDKMKVKLMEPLNEQTVNGKPTSEPLNYLSAENCCASKPDLASIIINKEPELYRNGCTQRIRAFEQNLLTGNLPLPGQTNDGYSHLKNELIVREGETAKKACTLASPKVDNMVIQAENMTGLKEKVHKDGSCDKGPVVKFFRRLSSRKIGRCTHIKTPTCANMIESDENLLETTGEDSEKDLNSCFVPTSTESDKNSKDNLDISSKDENHVSQLTLMRQEYKVADHTSDASICKLNHVTVDIPLANSDYKDEKTCKAIEAPSKTVNDRPFKYTFRRKRKREPLSSHKDDTVIEKKITSKRKTCNKQSAKPELPKSSLVIESSRDSRRLVQVARQLISLSGKRWS